jgi:hypothetical protein
MKLRGHRTELRADAAMPVKPVRQRHESPRTGDNKGAARRAAGGFLDLNVTYALGILWCLHYVIPWLCGYRFVDLPGGGRRKLKGRERVRTINGWGVAGMKKLSRKNGERPLTLDAMLGYCADVGACPVKETKSRAFATSDLPWILLRDLCVKHGVPMWCKALTNMWGFKAKVIRAARVGVPLAAIYGKGLRGRVRRLARTRRIEQGWRDGVRVHRTW